MAKATKGEPFGWGQFVTYLSGFCVLVLCLGMLLGVTLGMGPLEERAAGVVGHGPVTVRIQWPAIDGTSGATWLPLADQEVLTASAQDAAGACEAFRADPLARVSQTLGSSGWFESPPAVARTGGRTLEVSGTWRTPAAVVRWDGKDHLISWEAMPMPPVYEMNAARLPVIVGTAVGPPKDRSGARDLATPWAGEDVGGSLELLRTIAAQPWVSQVKGVDASRYSTEGLLMLVTPDNSRVVWGGRPSKPRLGEVTTAQKLVHIGQVWRDTKRIDGGYPLIYVNTQRIQLDTSASASAAQQAP